MAAIEPQSRRAAEPQSRRAECCSNTYLIPGEKHQQCPREPKDGARGPQRGNLLLRPPTGHGVGAHIRAHVAPDAAQQIDCHEPPPPSRPLCQGPERVQRDVVQEQVDDAPVQKDGREQSPDLALVHQRMHVHPQLGKVQLVGKGHLQDKHGRVDGDNAIRQQPGIGGERRVREGTGGVCVCVCRLGGWSRR